MRRGWCAHALVKREIGMPGKPEVDVGDFLPQ